MIRVARLGYGEFHWSFIDRPYLDFNMENYIKGEEHVWDCDNCGDAISYWVAVGEYGPKFYKCDHSWCWEHYGQDEAMVVNEFDVTVVFRDEIPGKYADDLICGLICRIPHHIY